MAQHHFRMEEVNEGLRNALSIALLPAVVLISGCKPDSAPAPSLPSTPLSSSHPPQPSWFEDITEKSGIHFQHHSGSQGQYFMPEHIGSGGAVIDYDRDGRMDLYLVQNAGPKSGVRNQLFHQKPDGTFENRSAGSGVDVDGYGMGAVTGDINNDGWPDLLVTEFGRSRTFLNLRNGKFRETTLESGLDNPHWGTAATFLDYDRDGWLDVAIANYVDYPPLHRCHDALGALEYCGPEGFPRSVTRLFRNQGTDRGQFTDVTVISGLASKPGPALGILAADFSGDGWPDLFLADDASPNRLFVNQKNGTFRDEAAARGLAYNGLGQVAGNMGAALGDVDGNGHQDLFVTHLAEEHHGLWMQDVGGVFSDKTGAAGLTRLSWRGTGFGAVLEDFDQDGDLDLAFLNGRVKRSRSLPDQVAPELDSAWQPYAQRAQLARNLGKGLFEDISEANPELTGLARVGRALLVADLDGDGGLDLVTCNIGGSARILHNRITNRGHWLMVRVLDSQGGGRDAIGATVRVKVGGGKQVRVLQPSSGYLSSQDPRVHFGLGVHASYESLEIIWPGGEVQTWPGGAADRVILVQRRSSGGGA